MDHWRSPFTRRRFLQAAAGVTGAMALGGATPFSRLMAQGPTGTLNWFTWSDHYYPEQLDAVLAAIGIGASPTLFSDNVEAYTKLKEVGGQLDMVSGDALWVTHNFEEGLIDAFDINALEVSKGLYPIAREFEIWTKPEGYLGYPFGWSPVQVYYDPAHVSPEPDSWEVLVDPKYVGRVVTEEQPIEVMAYMGKLDGVEDPYNMTEDEVAMAKDLLTRFKPNIVRLAPQNTDTVTSLATGESWLGTGNLGTDDRVKEAGGPQLKVFTPKEGTVGWMDSEMIVHGGANQSLVMPFLEAAQQPEYIAENFLKYGRPLFNEAAYKILVDNGHQERADHLLYNKPETVLTMTLKGPGQSAQAAIDAFNEVMGVGG